MKFPKSYKCLNNSTINNGKYKITPIRFEDRLDIMKWRNEQIYHLRQKEKLNKETQNIYFKITVNKLFNEKKPDQILFSYLENDKCIGYGGIVHINWVDKIGEISFIINTELESKYFEFHWKTYLNLIERIAFEDLKFEKIYAYAFDLRKNLYPILESKKYYLKNRIKNKLKLNNKWYDALIYCKEMIQIRSSNIKDSFLIYNWSNDSLVRSQSFNSKKIDLKEHEKWYQSKLKNERFLFYIFEICEKPFSLVRFEIKKDKTVIGILVDNKYRGKKLSHKVLNKACKEYFKCYNKPIFAYIKKTNIYSVSAFKKAGFKLLNNVEINEIPSLVYQLK